MEFLSLKGSCTRSSESTLVKMPHCWKSHVAAHIVCSFNCYRFFRIGAIFKSIVNYFALFVGLVAVVIFVVVFRRWADVAPILHSGLLVCIKGGHFLFYRKIL